MGRPFKVQPVSNVDQSDNNNQQSNQLSSEEIPLSGYKELVTNELLSNPIPGLPDKPTFRVSEVANYFDVSERTVYLWIEHGHLAIEYTPAGQKRITRESINSCRFKPKKHVNNLPDSSTDS
jgi:excisionase family DNA binding protein